MMRSFRAGKIIFGAVMFFFAISPVVAAEATYDLEAGWNMISTSFQEGVELSTIKTECQSSMNRPPSFDSSEEFRVVIRTYDTSAGEVQEVERMEPGKGYGVWVDGACEFTLTGTPVENMGTIALSPGWNLVSADTTFDAVSQYCNLPYGQEEIWHGETTDEGEQWTHPTELAPTKSYWVYTESSCSIGYTPEAGGSGPGSGGDDTGREGSGANQEDSSDASDDAGGASGELVGDVGCELYNPGVTRCEMEIGESVAVAGTVVKLDATRGAGEPSAFEMVSGGSMEVVDVGGGTWHTLNGIQLLADDDTSSPYTIMFNADVSTVETASGDGSDDGSGDQGAGEDAGDSSDSTDSGGNTQDDNSDDSVLGGDQSNQVVDGGSCSSSSPGSISHIDHEEADYICASNNQWVKCPSDGGLNPVNTPDHVTVNGRTYTCFAGSWSEQSGDSSDSGQDTDPQPACADQGPEYGCVDAFSSSCSNIANEFHCSGDRFICCKHSDDRPSKPEITRVRVVHVDNPWYLGSDECQLYVDVNNPTNTPLDVIVTANELGTGPDPSGRGYSAYNIGALGGNNDGYAKVATAIEEVGARAEVRFMGETAGIGGWDDCKNGMDVELEWRSELDEDWKVAEVWSVPESRVPGTHQEEP